MPIYMIPSDKELQLDAQDYPLEYMKEEDFSTALESLFNALRRTYLVIPYTTEAFVQDVLAFILFNDLARVYHYEYDSGDNGIVIIPHSEKDEDRELLTSLNDYSERYGWPTREIDEKTFKSSFVRLDKDGNEIPVKI